MKAIRKIIITACFLLLSTATAFADYPAFRGETLRYDIIYHWGIVWKHAGSATLSIHQTGNKYGCSRCAIARHPTKANTVASTLWNIHTRQSIVMRNARDCAPDVRLNKPHWKPKAKPTTC